MSGDDARRRVRRPAGRRIDLPQTIAGSAYIAVGLALACAIAWPVYETPRLALIAAFAAVGSVGTAVLARRGGWPFWRHAAVVAGLYVVAAVPLAIPSALSSPAAFARGLLDALTGVVLGWKQLLTLDLPVGEYQAVLIPALVLFLVGASVAAGLALSPGRRAVVAVPVVLGMGVFGIAFGRTDPGPAFVFAGVTVEAPREVLLGIVLVAVSLLWLSLRSRLQRRSALAAARGTVGQVGQGRGTTGAAIRRRALGTGILAVALLAGLLAAPTLAGATPRETLRTSTEPLLVVQKQPSPLARYRASFEKGAYDSVLFTVSGAGSAVDRMRLATLDDWDGEHFLVSSNDRFARLPGGTAAAGAQKLTVTIGDGYSGIWLPLPAGVSTAPVFNGQRASALADSFYLDRSSGSGVVVAPGAAGATGVAAGDAYEVDGTGTASVPLADPGSSALLDLTAHPQLAAWLKAQGQPRTAAGFQELISRLRDRGYLSHSLAEDDAASSWIAALRSSSAYPFESSFAGHSSARVDALFTELLQQQNRVGAGADRDLLVAGVGDDEQFAAAGALLARAVGYESRVVVGVRLGGGATGGIPACSSRCTGADLAAWIEVRAPGASAWTTLDVEPQFTTPPTLISLNRQLPKNPTVPEQPQAGAVQPPSAQHDDRDSARAVQQEQPEWIAVLLRVLTIAGLSAATLLLVLLPFLALLVAKSVRRRVRRRAAVPEVAVVGAWEEVIDAHVDGGRTAPRGTRRDQAEALGGEAPAELAALVDGAVFALHPPSRAAADRAWDLVDAERARLRGERGALRAILAALNPASFLRGMERPALRTPRLRIPALSSPSSRKVNP